MSYTPTTWAAGDTVTAAKLNKLEQGVASSGVLVIHETVSGRTHTLDKTWQEIHDADLPVFVIDNPDGDGTARLWITNIMASDYNYFVSVDGVEYRSGTADGYPSFSDK